MGNSQPTHIENICLTSLLKNIQIDDHLSEFFAYSKRSLEDSHYKYISSNKGICVGDNYEEIAQGGFNIGSFHRSTFVPFDVYLKGIYIILSDYMYRGIGGIFPYIILQVTGEMCSVFEVEIEDGEVKSIKNTQKNSKSPYTIITVMVGGDQFVFVAEDVLNTIQISIYEKYNSDRYSYDRSIIINRVKEFIENSGTDKRVIFNLPRCDLGVGGTYFNLPDMGYCEIFGIFWFYVYICIKSSVNGLCKNNMMTFFGIKSSVHVNIDDEFIVKEKYVNKWFREKFKGDNSRLREYIIRFVYEVFEDYTLDTGLEYEDMVYKLFEENKWESVKTFTEEVVTTELVDILKNKSDSRKNTDFFMDCYYDILSHFDSFIKCIEKDIEKCEFRR